MNAAVYFGGRWLPRLHLALTNGLKANIAQRRCTQATPRLGWPVPSEQFTHAKINTARTNLIAAIHASFRLALRPIWISALSARFIVFAKLQRRANLRVNFYS